MCAVPSGTAVARVSRLELADIVRAQGNPRVIYALLFRAAADTLLTFGRDPRHLGGTIGITAILHTWGQTLSQHMHPALPGHRWCLGC